MSDSSNETSKYDIFKDSFAKNMDTHDKLVEELYEYNKLMTQGVEYDDKTSTNFQQKYLGEDAYDMDTKLYEILEQNEDLKSQLMNIVNKDTFLIEESLDVYKNKELVNEILKYRTENLEKKQDKVNNDISTKQRHVELGVYTYQKNKAMIRMFYVLIVYFFVMYAIHYVNRNILTLKDRIYSILVGAVTSIFIIMIARAIYDFNIRSEHIFDEYDDYWSGKIGLNTNKKFKVDLSLCEK
jgi:hypothetical protein